jgi:hypothetical protein
MAQILRLEVVINYSMNIAQAEIYIYACTLKKRSMKFSPIWCFYCFVVVNFLSAGFSNRLKPKNRKIKQNKNKKKAKLVIKRVTDNTWNVIY